MDSSFLGALVGALIGAIAPILVLRFNYRQLFAETVSKNRMEWIQGFREEISIIVATIECIHTHKYNTACKTNSETPCKNDEYICNMIYEGEKAKAKLMTRLNQDITKYGNEYNEVLFDMLSKNLFTNKTEDEKNLTIDLLDVTRKILEHEWKRVKEEAKGEKY